MHENRLGGFYAFGGMGFHHERRISIRGRRSIRATAAAIILLLEFFVANKLSTSTCHAHKAPSSLSTSSFSLRQSSKTTTSARGTHIQLGAILSEQNQIAAWVPQHTYRGNQLRRNQNHRLPPCAGYYIPSPTSFGRKIGRSTLFSRNRDDEKIPRDDNDDNINNAGDTGESNFRPDDNIRRRKGILSVLDDFSFGVNRVNKDFLHLTWRVYSRTLLWMTPLVVLLFIVLPACSTSSSPSLQLFATNVQGFLKSAFESLARGSRVLFVRPMHGLVRWIISWSSAATADGSSVPISAWNSRSTLKGTLLWGLFWGPIVEELIFRFAFRGLWKVLFRPVSIGPSSNKGLKDSDSFRNNAALARNPIFNTIFRVFRRNNSHRAIELAPKYNNRSWRIASGICFGIAHFSNFFPIDPSQYTFEGEIRLPSGTRRERFLLALFPGNFASTHKEFCLTSMVLTGAVYQATHCFISTMLLYGPLLDAPKSQKGGIFTAIGAHIAWNANVIWLMTNLKLRALCKVFVIGSSKTTKKASSSNE